MFISYLQSIVKLFAADGSTGDEAEFKVSAGTSNGPVDLSFLEQPLNSTLVVGATTSNKYAEVALHPAFEGSFYLRTSSAYPSLVDGHPKDPSGEGRTRHIDSREFNGYERSLNGHINWDGKEDKRSTVTVQTNNEPAILTLLDV